MTININKILKNIIIILFIIYLIYKIISIINIIFNEAARLDSFELIDTNYGKDSKYNTLLVDRYILTYWFI